MKLTLRPGRYFVRRQSPRTYGIYTRTGHLVEGGFFSRQAAEVACWQWERTGL